MKQFRVILCLFLLGSILDVKIQASYYGFFCYADKNNDGKLTMGIKGEPNEWDHPNKAWTSEFQDLYKKITMSESLKKEIERKGYITLEEFKLMSIPGGNENHDISLMYKLCFKYV